MSSWTALYPSDQHFCDHPKGHSLSSGGFMGSPDSGDDDLAHSAWDMASRLKISFVPDGTPVSIYESKLYESFSHLLTGDQLESTILGAFQTWAQESNLNVGVVDDDGSPFGTGSPTQGDQRFGDIRIGTAPMTQDVFAISIHHDELVSGSWAGDILFNSRIKFRTVDELYSVVLHEAGHVFGLEHSENVDSVMHPTSRLTTLHTEDIANLKAIYGNRMLDQYDIDDSNNLFEDATRIKNSGSLDGSIPLVVYGDIDSTADPDYFYLQKLSGYVGPITFRLVSEGVSLLTPKMTLYDENGNQLSQVTGSGTRGDDLSLTVANGNDGTYFVRVDGVSGTNANEVGSYALVATFDNNVTYDPTLLEKVIRGHYHFLDQGDVQDLFAEPQTAFFENDLNTDDTFQTASELDTSPGFADNTRYKIQASIHNQIDVDYYQFMAPDFGPPGSGVLTLNLLSMSESGLIPTAHIFDSQQNLISSDVLVNGNGEYVLQVDNIQSDQEYFVRVAANKPGDRFDTGNYDLQLSFANDLVSFTEIGSGQLGGTKEKEHHTLYVAQTQLFHFAIGAEESAQLGKAIVWMSIYDEEGNVVYRGATKPGETRTAKSVVLRPGSYSVQVSMALPREQTTSPFGYEGTIDYQVNGVGVSDPTGPEIINPSDLPFPKCGPDNSLYCYPGFRSPDPFVLINGQHVNTPKVQDPPNLDLNAWYWYAHWLINEVPDDL